MLRVDELHVSYGDIEALHGVSLDVAAHEVVAILGANGAGKTTLLRTVSGLHPVQSGRVLLEDEPLDRIPANRRVHRGLAHVPEGRRIFPGLTVFENLMVAVQRGRSKDSRNDLENVFDLFPRLRERRNQLGWSLSGGEQQMLAVGRAMMTRPKVILLDEPSLGLAPMVANEVYERLDSISRQGMTILIVEQNTVLALSVASRAYVIENGRIVLKGSAAELADDPRVKEAYLGT